MGRVGTSLYFSIPCGGNDIQCLVLQVLGGGATAFHHKK